MKVKLKQFFPFSTIILLLSTLLLSCEKEDPTIARILVVDTEGVPVSDALVNLYGSSTTDPKRSPIIDDNLYTDNQGYAVFDYSDYFNLGQAGVFVLDINVTKDFLTGVGIIKIEQEKANEQKVIIQ